MFARREIALQAVAWSALLALVGWLALASSGLVRLPGLGPDLAHYPVRLSLPGRTEARIMSESSGRPVPLAEVGAPEEMVAAELERQQDQAVAEQAGARRDLASVNEFLARWNADGEAGERPQPVQPAARAARPRTNADGLIPVQFDLASSPAAADALEARKRVVMNGAEAGSVRIRIDGAARIYISRDELAALLPGAQIPGGEEGFVSFAQLRDRGIEIRYDAGADRLLISGQGA